MKSNSGEGQLFINNKKILKEKI
jgi:hypothetical protein